MTEEYEASKSIDYKHSYPCFEYDGDCKNTDCRPDVPPHCAFCGYVREDHETGE